MPESWDKQSFDIPEEHNEYDLDDTDNVFYASEDLVEVKREVFEWLTSNLDNKNLLTIELQDETSVPKVIYKGEEIPNMVNVSFNWETDTEYMGGLSYAIEHFEKENYIVSNRIERKVKGHAVD